jgi:hypothetical protein
MEEPKNRASSYKIFYFREGKSEKANFREGERPAPPIFSSQTHASTFTRKFVKRGWRFQISRSEARNHR